MTTLEPAINATLAHELIDEDARESGLRALRTRNFLDLMAGIESMGVREGHLLEVGCAHGWFLDIARGKFKVLGIEPDLTMFRSAASRGLPVRSGYFPDALAQGEKFDVIVFNDVIEHIPDIVSVLRHCRERLNERGLLVLNLPSSGGVFYRLAKFFSHLGFGEFFDRLWQKGLPSPHVHYFNAVNLTSLLENCGFDARRKGSLSTIRLSGLYTRISYTGQHGLAARIAMVCVIALCMPLLRIFPSDIFFVIAARKTVAG